MTDNAIAEIINDTGKLLTISIPGGPLPVHLTVDHPGGRRDWCGCWPGQGTKSSWNRLIKEHDAEFFGDGQPRIHRHTAPDVGDQGAGIDDFPADHPANAASATG